MKTCKIDGCELRSKSLGWCAMHYTRWKRWGDPSIVKQFQLPKGQGQNTQPCKIEGCDALAFCRGWCAMHYQAWRIHGDAAHALTRQARKGKGLRWRKVGDKFLLPHQIAYTDAHGPIPRCECQNGELYHVHHKDHDHSNNDPSNLEALRPGDHARHHSAKWQGHPCRVEGCESKSTKGFCDGFCPAHYQQLRKHGKIISVSAKRLGKQKKWITCSVEGCDSKGYCQSYCIRHYDQMRTHGEIKHVEKVVGGTKRWTSCKVEGCVPTSMKGACQGYCERHYIQMRKFGKIVSIAPISKSEGGTLGAAKRWGPDSA